MEKNMTRIQGEFPLATLQKTAPVDPACLVLIHQIKNNPSEKFNKTTATWLAQQGDLQIKMHGLKLAWQEAANEQQHQAIILLAQKEKISLEECGIKRTIKIDATQYSLPSQSIHQTASHLER